MKAYFLYGHAMAKMILWTAKQTKKMNIWTCIHMYRQQKTAPYVTRFFYQCIIVCKTTSLSRSRRSHISRKKSARDASRSMSFSYVAHNARRSTFAFLAFLAFSIVLIKSFFDTFIFCLPSFFVARDALMFSASRLCLLFYD